MADNMIGGSASLLDTSSNLSALEASAPGYVPDQLAPEQFQSKQLSDIIEAKQQQRKEALAAKEVKDNSSYVERLTAAAKGTDTYLLGKYLLDPAEIPVAGYNAMEDIKGLKFPVSPDDINYLSKARSPEGFSERTKALLAQRGHQDLASASPVLSFLVQAVDPVYLLADAVSMGAGHAMKASRIATGVLAAAGAASVSAAASEVRPVTEEEILMNTLLNGAASVAVYKPPKVRTETGGDVKPIAEAEPAPHMADNTPSANKVEPAPQPDTTAPVGKPYNLDAPLDFYTAQDLYGLKGYLVYRVLDDAQGKLSLGELLGQMQSRAAELWVSPDELQRELKDVHEYFQNKGYSSFENLGSAPVEPIASTGKPKEPAPAAKEKPAAPVVDTRGAGIRLHGTSSELPETLQEFTYSDQNIYGQGFYTTDALDVAEGYTKKVKGKSPSLYTVEEVRPVSMYDMEAPLDSQVLDILRSMDDELIDHAVKATSEDNTLRAVFNEMRAEAENMGYSRDGVQELFDGIQGELLAKGYGGYQHIGGLGTNTKPHTVKIYWNPKEQIRVTKVTSEDVMKALRPTEPVVESVPTQAKEALEGATQAVKAHGDAADVINKADEIVIPTLDITLPRDADGLVQYPPRKKGYLASPLEADNIREHVVGKPLDKAAEALIALAPTKASRVIADRLRARLSALRDMGVDLANISRGAPGSNVLGYTSTLVGDGISRIEVKLNDLNYNTALHELTHAATMLSISYAKKYSTSEYKAAVKLWMRLKGEYSKATTAYEALSPTVRAKVYPQEQRDFFILKSNRLSSIDEMLAWGLSDTTFQKWLKTLPATSGKSAWSKFVEVVAGLLGLTKETRTALHEVLEAANHFLDSSVGVDTKYVSMRHEMGINLNAVSHTSTGRYLLEWSLFKSFSSFSDKAKEWADKLLADPINQSSSNASSIYRTLYADHTVKLEQAENLTMLALRKQGWGVIRRMRDPKGFRTAQLELHNKVMREMEGRNASGAARITPDDTVAALADRYAEYGQYVAKRLEDFGMAEAGFADKNKNYVPRRMQVGLLQELESAMGKTAVRDQLAASVLKSNPTMTLNTAKAVAYAMIERAKSKVNLTEQPNVHVDSTSRDTLKGMLSRSGLPQEDIDKAIAMLGTESNDAGKPPMLKYRVKLDYSMPLGSGTQTIGDLFSHDLTTLYESYNRRISGRMSMWKVGLQRQTDIDKAWKEIAESIHDPVHKADAKQLFDGTINYLLGNPVGEAVPEAMRTTAGMTQAVALGSSPFWQTLDYFKIMAQHGALDTLGAALRSLPEARALWKEMKAATKEGRQVALDMDEVLTAQIASDIRMRPILDVYEDGFSVGKSPWAQRAETARDATPFLSGQKYLHFHQAKTISALSVQTVRKAANGDAKAVQAMRRYGVSDAQLQAFKHQFDKFGTAPDKWDRTVWLEMNTALLRMADDSVLRMQLGEIPAFAQFSSLGKFLFTFRSFTLAAQNKVLLSTLKNDGAVGVAMLLAYQYPMSCLAVAANMAINNDPNITQKAVVERALGYVPVLGLGSELVGILNGYQRGFGSPGLLYIDKAYRAIGQAAQLDGKGLAATTVSMLPFVSVIPGSRALQNALKEESKQ